MASKDRYVYTPYIGKTVEVSPGEMERDHVARFAQLEDDQDIFPDIKTPEGQRRHFHVISEGGHLGPTTAIRTKHHFHLGYLEVPPGSSAALHAHDALEVFIPMSGKFEFRFNDTGQDSVVLEPLDTISVPVGVVRTFKNVGNTNAILMVIYDEPGEILGKIYINEEIAASRQRKATSDVSTDA